jgi:hypothetical protein
MPSLRTARCGEGFSVQALEYALPKKDRTADLWDRAEECRAVANVATDPRLKAEYLKLANDYLKLAAREEVLRKQRSDDRPH